MDQTTGITIVNQAASEEYSHHNRTVVTVVWMEWTFRGERKTGHYFFAELPPHREITFAVVWQRWGRQRVRAKIDLIRPLEPLPSGMSRNDAWRLTKAVVEALERATGLKVSAGADRIMLD